MEFYLVFPESKFNAESFSLGGLKKYKNRHEAIQAAMDQSASSRVNFVVLAVHYIGTAKPMLSTFSENIDAL